MDFLGAIGVVLFVFLVQWLCRGIICLFRSIHER